VDTESTRWPPTLRPSQPTWAVSALLGSCHPHPLSSGIITQPTGWYSLYCPTEGRRLSRPRHWRKVQQPVPETAYHNDCHNACHYRWHGSNLGSHMPQQGAPLLGHCNLHRQIGVKDLPKVTSRQCQPTGRDSNLRPLSHKPDALTTGPSRHTNCTSTYYCQFYMTMILKLSLT